MYTVHQAKTNLSRLIREACAGKEVVIARGKNAVVKLVPFSKELKNRVPGRLKGNISYSSDAFKPLTRKERQLLGFE
ncbi:MAG TPA: type II toxin-antitoxin system Phd/YefM family antitoxin [Candidatus Eremiobacteraceae bacterium]|nr:type II toxin-antitoxin system Phd/YefM family antitoxin [Candidatus Eremiobacteraceae bacterium]